MTTLTKKMHKNYRYTVIQMIVLLLVINYIDRGVISYASAPIIKEFGLDAKSWGAVLGYFGYGYLFGALFGGALADKKGPKFVWILVATCWSVFEIMTAFAGNIGIAIFGGSALIGFAVIRILFGFSEGPSYATFSRTAANWSAPKERGFVASLSMMSAPVGSMLTAPIAVGMLTLTGSWKVMVIILGILGLLWVLICRKYFTDKPDESPYVSKEELDLIRSSSDLLDSEITLVESEKEHGRWYYFFKNPTLVANAIGFCAFQYVNILIVTWTPKYLQDVFHYSLGSLWYLGMVPWIGACFTAVLGGKISDWLRKKTGSLRIARGGVAVVSLLLTAVCMIAITTVHSVTSVMILMFLGNAFNLLSGSVYWAIVVDTEPSRTGTYGGISHFIANIAIVVAPTLTGVLVQDYGYGSMFSAAAIASCLGMVAMLFVNPGKAKRKVISSKSIKNNG